MSVKMYIDEHYIGTFRAMCDSGSQVNLARYNLIRPTLQVTKPLNIELIGISEIPVRIKRQVTVYLKPWFHCETPVKVKADLMLLPKHSPRLRFILQ